VTVRVVRGREKTIETDREVSLSLVDWTAHTGRTAVRVWRPHRQVAFGRRDKNSDGYGRARRIAHERGYPPVEREVGGRAVAYTGTTVALVRMEPGGRDGIDDRYDRATAAVRRALGQVGVDAEEGEPPDSFCPGTHSLQSRGKIVGLAQRVRRDASVTGGVCVVRDHRAIAGILGPVYEALGVPLDPDSVGSVARAGGNDDPAAVIRAIESELVGDREREVVDAEDVETGDPG